MSEWTRSAISPTQLLTPRQRKTFAQRTTKRNASSSTLRQGEISLPTPKDNNGNTLQCGRDDREVLPPNGKTVCSSSLWGRTRWSNIEFISYLAIWRVSYFVQDVYGIYLYQYQWLYFHKFCNDWWLMAFVSVYFHVTRISQVCRQIVMIAGMPDPVWDLLRHQVQGHPGRWECWRVQ